MNFVIYTDWHELPAVVSAHDEQSAKESVFATTTWYECVSGSLELQGQKLVLACVLSGDRVMAILPLVNSEGDNFYALRHRYSPHYHIISAGEERQQVLACLARGLAQVPMRGLVLEPIVDGDNDFKQIAHLLNAAGFVCERIFRHYNWIHRVHEQSYAEYLAGRPASLRNTIARKKRKLEREQAYAIRLFTGDDVTRRMPEYYAVYSASWKANEQYADFLNEVVGRFSSQGWTRLAVLYIKGRPAAAQLWFVCHGRASIFRLSYDEEWKRYSPGSILTSFLMAQVIDVDKVEEIDFLTGNEAYKRDWMSERRECFALSCVKTRKAENRASRIVDWIRRKLPGR